MKVFITGGHGLVGSEIVKALKKKNVDVLSPGSAELDLLNPSEVTDFILSNRPELLIHSAWYTKHGKFWNAPENEAWYQASFHLAQKFYENGGQRFFGLGTCAEYEWDDLAVCVEGLTSMKASTYYGQMKRQFQLKLMKLAAQNQKSAIWGRVFFPFGPGEQPTRVLPLMIRALIEKKPVELSSGLQKRDFLFTEDLGELIAGLAFSKAEGDYNLSSGHAFSIREVGQLLSQIAGASELLFQFSDRPLSEPALIVGSTEKRDLVFPWKAQNTLAQGLEKTFNWWVNQRHK